jgi:hypothetical protein
MRTMLAWREPSMRARSDALLDVTAAGSTPTVGKLRELIVISSSRRPNGGSLPS